MAAGSNDSVSGIDTGILDNALVLIAILEKDGRVVVWNHAAETITGYSQTDVIGQKTIWQHLYPDREYRSTVTNRIAAILATRNYFENLETSIRTRNGDTRIMVWNTKELAGTGRQLMMTVGMDVTAQRMGDQFRESIIDNANILITVLEKGTVIVWNKAAETITGYPRDEVIGRRDIWKALYPDDGYRREVTRQITDIISKKSYFENLETKIVTRSGETKVISWNTRQMGTGSATREIAIGLDITARKEAEEALLAYMTEMAMRLKGPVEIIRDNIVDIAQLIRGGKIEPEEIALILDGQARNANQVAQNVLEFQRAIAMKRMEIPDAYRKFLAGD
jgi:PAS domain S-box-containing protein